MGTLQLAQLYNHAGYEAYAERARTCATWLQYLAQPDGTRQLFAANFCQLRLCPLCTSRRAKRAAHRLSDVMDGTAQEVPGVRYLFLTLTVRNCGGQQLREAVGDVLAAWDRMARHRPVQRATLGWFRALEITRNGRQYHPHVHAILAVPEAYFARRSGLYLTHSDWVQHWREALGVDYDPSVRIARTVEGKGGQAAALEAAKYVTKSSDYIDPRLTLAQGAQIVDIYTRALYRRRLTAYGGVMRDMARRLDVEDDDTIDLAKADGPEVLRPDVAVLLEDYHWHFGAGDYILSDRRRNPLQGVRE